MRNASVAAGVSLVCLLLLALTGTDPVLAQTRGCTESVIRNGHPPTADDAYTYMPAYGKPLIGKPAIQEGNVKNFGDRTNITRSWTKDHRISATSDGDMAYEYGTMRMGYDEGGKRTEFEAVILTVFKARNGVCQMVALTMQPLEEQAGR
jgi:hypothetical protein